MMPDSFPAIWRSHDLIGESESESLQRGCGTRDLPWAIRDTIGLTGTKFGCGGGFCASYTVPVNGRPVRSCVTPASEVVGREITTIEGLSANADHPAQIAWREGDVPACGYCQSGQMMAAPTLLAKAVSHRRRHRTGNH